MTDAVSRLYAATYLRVFEPWKVFDQTQQDRWAAQYAAGADRDEVQRHAKLQGLQRMLRTPVNPVPDTEEDAAIVLTYQGERYACPLQTRLRSWFAADTVPELLPEAVAEEAFPTPTLRTVEEQREKWVQSGGDIRVRTRSALWEIPFSWFVLVWEIDTVERVLDEDGKIAVLRVVAPIKEAKKRASQAIQVVDEAMPEAELLEEVTELFAWLELFDDSSLVELDYGPFGELVYPDESPLDIRLGLECLAEGDLTGAAAAYRRYISRWLPVRSLARAC